MSIFVEPERLIFFDYLLIRIIAFFKKTNIFCHSNHKNKFNKNTIIYKWSDFHVEERFLCNKICVEYLFNSDFKKNFDLAILESKIITYYGSKRLSKKMALTYLSRIVGMIILFNKYKLKSNSFVYITPLDQKIAKKLFDDVLFNEILNKHGLYLPTLYNSNSAWCYIYTVLIFISLFIKSSFFNIICSSNNKIKIASQTR